MVSNLNKYLKIYKGCLTHLINYNDNDVLPMINAIVLSWCDVIRNTYLVDGEFVQFRKYRFRKLSHRTRFYKIEIVPQNLPGNIARTNSRIYLYPPNLDHENVRLIICIYLHRVIPCITILIKYLSVYLF